VSLANRTARRHKRAGDDDTNMGWVEDTPGGKVDPSIPNSSDADAAKPDERVDVTDEVTVPFDESSQYDTTKYEDQGGGESAEVKPEEPAAFSSRRSAANGYIKVQPNNLYSDPHPKDVLDQAGVPYNKIITTLDDNGDEGNHWIDTPDQEGAKRALESIPDDQYNGIDYNQKLPSKTHYKDEDGIYHTTDIDGGMPKVKLQNEMNSGGQNSTASHRKQADRNPDCRYCNRYDRDCGRDHSEETKGDWGRPREGATQVKKASEISCMELADAYVEAGLIQANDRYNTARVFAEKLSEETVKDRLTLLSNVAKVQKTREARTASAPVDGRRSLTRAPRLGQPARRVASSGDGDAMDTLLFIS